MAERDLVEVIPNLTALGDSQPDQEVAIKNKEASQDMVNVNSKPATSVISFTCNLKAIVIDTIQHCWKKSQGFWMVQ